MPFTDSVLKPDDIATKSSAIAFAIDDFLAAEASKDLLRFSTAGSVDDGKSTLIGRLLHDSRNVYEDQLRSVSRVSATSGSLQPTVDFALLTDGLRAEREQGITIDVAYRFFATQRRKFIIADTPGHEQYTRNMATGASTANLAIILIDARKGILTQSRRHAYIASLLGIRHFVAAINKMDLVDFSDDVYHTLSHEFAELVGQYTSASLTTIPLSALNGDNVVERSELTPWYEGPTLLEHLEQVPVWDNSVTQPFRMPVQRVIRPNHQYRGFAGQIASGTLCPGDTVVALPSGRSSKIASITTFDGDLAEASAPLSIAFTLAEELDISRGDLIASPNYLPQHASSLEASLIWFDTQKLETHAPYLFKHGTSTVRARVMRLLHRINIHSLAEEPASSLAMNDIGVAELELTRPLFLDPYTTNRFTGSFILIDPNTNATLAAGMIRRGLTAHTETNAHKPALIAFTANSMLSVAEVEHRLLCEGALVVRTGVVAEQTLRALLSLGLIVLLDAEPTGSTFSALAEFNPLDAESFESTHALVKHLTRSGIPAPNRGGPG